MNEKDHPTVRCDDAVGGNGVHDSEGGHVDRRSGDVDDEPGGDQSARPRVAAHAWESLFRTQVAIMRRLQADDVWDDITMREYDVLFTLTTGQPEGMRLRDLNEGILLSQPSLSRMVERLAGRGLVARAAAPDDARGTLVRLTDQGRAMQRRIGRRHVRTIERYVGGALSDADLVALTELLDALRAAQRWISDVSDEL